MKGERLEVRLAENGGRVRAVDEGADLAAGDGAFERAFGEEVEDEDGDLVLLAEREGRGRAPRRR